MRPLTKDELFALQDDLIITLDSPDGYLTGEPNKKLLVKLIDKSNDHTCYYNDSFPYDPDANKKWMESLKYGHVFSFMVINSKGKYSDLLYFWKQDEENLFLPEQSEIEELLKGGN